MALVVRAYPVRSREAVGRFIGELQSRAEETRNFYRSFNVKREMWFFQQTEHGPIIIGVTELNDVAKNAEAYKESDDPFAAWFKSRVVEVSGVDPNETPLGPPSQMVFDSSVL
ncbi:MAG: hypothetical protein AABO58_13960 [Acidobacteriota bacterium]